MIGSHPSMRMMQPRGGVWFWFMAVSTAVQCVLSCDLVCMIVIRPWSSKAL